MEIASVVGKSKTIAPIHVCSMYAAYYAHIGTQSRLLSRWRDRTSCRRRA